MLYLPRDIWEKKIWIFLSTRDLSNTRVVCKKPKIDPKIDYKEAPYADYYIKNFPYSAPCRTKFPIGWLCQLHGIKLH